MEDITISLKVKLGFVKCAKYSKITKTSHRILNFSIIVILQQLILMVFIWIIYDGPIESSKTL